MSAPLTALLEAARAQVAADADMAAFAGGGLDEPLPLRPPAPSPLPVTERLAAFAAASSPRTRSLAAAMVAAGPSLQWRHSYAPDEVGQDFLDQSGWFNLVSPEGPFVSERLRVSFGLWSQGLVYPRHWHQPEEIYLVVAGSAEFVTDGMPTRLLRAGETRRHESWLPHGARMTEGPLVAMALWRGAGLTDKSIIDPDALPPRAPEGGAA